MASQDLKHRVSDGDTDTTTMKDNNADANSGSATTNRTKRDKRTAMAKRGLRSLVIAVSLPLSLTFLTICFGSGYSYGPIKKPFWFPTMWALHLLSMVSSSLMGLAAWLVWAEGGFHKKPESLALYSAYFGLSSIWYPLVFGSGSSRAGLLVCLGCIGALIKFSRISKEVKPIAGNLVMPCLAWTAFLAVLNLKLVYI